MKHKMYRAVIVVDKSLDEAYFTALKGLQELDKFKVVRTNNVTHSIFIRVPVSLFTWGERMKITMTPFNDNRTEIQISSHSNYDIELASEPKNRKNLDIVERAVRKYM